MKSLSKKGFDVSAITTKLIMAIVGVIVVFTIIASTASDLTTAGDNVSDSGLPLAGLFSGGGVILLIFMAGILLALVTVFLKFHKKGG